MAYFPVCLSTALYNGAKVSYHTTDGSAEAGVDYEPHFKWDEAHSANPLYWRVEFGSDDVMTLIQVPTYWNESGEIPPGAEPRTFTVGLDDLMTTTQTAPQQGSGAGTIERVGGDIHVHGLTGAPTGVIAIPQGELVRVDVQLQPPSLGSKTFRLAYNNSEIEVYTDQGGRNLITSGSDLIQGGTFYVKGIVPSEHRGDAWISLSYGARTIKEVDCTVSRRVLATGTLKWVSRGLPIVPGGGNNTLSVKLVGQTIDGGFVGAPAGTYDTDNRQFWAIGAGDSTVLGPEQVTGTAPGWRYRVVTKWSINAVGSLAPFYGWRMRGAYMKSEIAVYIYAGGTTNVEYDWDASSEVWSYFTTEH